MVLTALSGVVQTDDGKDVLAYWSFNSNEKSGVIYDNNMRIADEGNGMMRLSFTSGSSLGGSDYYCLSPKYTRERGIGFTSFVGGGNVGLITETLKIELSTRYYENIMVNYALLCGISIQDTEHRIYYSFDGIDYTYYNNNTVNPLIPVRDNSYHPVGFDISAVSDVFDKQKVYIMIEMYEKVTGNRNTRIDNFLITGTPIYDFIPDRTDTIANTTITFEEGVADNITSTAVMPTLPPNAADDSESLALDLKGEGPWRIILENDKEYCAYNHGGAWIEVIKFEGNSESDGYFEIEIPSQSQRAGNELFVLFSNDQPTLPVELTAFKVFAYPGLAPKISWETASETALNGYYVLRGESPNLQSAQVISPLIHAQNSSLYMRYEFEDKTVVSEARYYYWLHILELNQIDSYAGPIALEYYTEESQTPEHTYAITGIRDIYPNPFNPSTNISFELADDSEVAFKMYNLRGEEVLGLESRPYPKGVHHIYIDSKTQAGRELPAGVYFLKMQAGASSHIRKITLLK